MIRWTRQQARRLAATGFLIALSGCAGEAAVDTPQTTGEGQQVAEGEVHEATIWAPGEGDHFWVGPESKETLGSGGEFHVYVDPETHPAALASFARYALGVGGSLPEHRHDKTEELAYFISGQGIARLYFDGEPRDIQVGPGHVWYNPPGVWHSVTNTGDEPLVLVFATIPNEKKGLLSFFRRISVKPGEEPTVLPPEEFARLATEHDMILRPPASIENE
jgi:mannose-6-phosphate isomerase-like protein (cupin superfamily)